MGQSFRSDMRPVPLRRGLADVVRTLGLAGAIGVGALLTVQQLSGGIGSRLFANWGEGNISPDAELPVDAMPLGNEAGDSFVKVTLGGETHLNAAAQSFLFPSVMSAERQVMLRRPVDVSTLLERGEAMPPVELATVFVKARAARLADAECARLMKRVAAGCSLVRAEMLEVPAESAGTTFEMSLTLNFTPRTATGLLPDADEMQFGRRTVTVEPLPDGIVVRVNADRTGVAYLDFVYADAEAACAEVRRVSGNCAIMNVDAAYKANSETRGTFSIAWMEPVQQVAEDQPAKPAG